MNRLAPFCVERGRSLAVTRDPDERAAAEIRAHLSRLATLDPGSVTLTAAAEELWTEYATEHDRRIDALGYPHSALLKRTRDHVARLALVFATDAGRLAVQPEDLLAAIEIGAFITASYDHLLAGRALGRGPEREASIEETCRRLLARRSLPQTKRDLARSWPSRPAPSSREIQRALDGMRDELENGKRGKTTTYWLAREIPHATRDTQLRENKGSNCRVSDGASHCDTTDRGARP